MIYEPYRSHTVALNSWQTWNAIDSGNARWWFSRASVSGIYTSKPCPQSAPCKWSTILSLFPNIGIHNTVTPSVVLKAGSGWSNFHGNVDALTIGVLGSLNVVTTYNFELGPTSKEECKHGGWQGIFENQGKCVSHFQSNKP